MAIKEVTLQRLDQHGGRILSIPIPEGGLVAGQLIRVKDENTLEFGTIEEFEASALSEVTGTVTAVDGSTLVLENGLVTEKTNATVTGLSDDWVVGLGDTVTFVNGLVTEKTDTTVTGLTTDWVVAVGDTVTLVNGLITAVTPA